MASFASPFVITGDLNVHFERPNDSATGHVNELLASYGATQHVQESTHVLGGYLDVVITGDDCQPTDIKVDDPGLSDHSLVRWRFNLRLSSVPVYEERERRLWRNFDIASFRAALTTSSLCEPITYDGLLDVNLLVQTYNDTVEKLLDVHAPRSKVRCRVRRQTDPWYDSDCHAAKRRTRKLERRYKRWKSDHSRSVWLQSLRSMHRFVDQKRNEYWRSKTDSQASARELWRSIDAILCRDSPNATKNLRARRMTLPIFLSRKWRRYELLLTVRRHRYLGMYSRNHRCACSHL